MLVSCGENSTFDDSDQYEDGTMSDKEDDEEEELYLLPEGTFYQNDWIGTIEWTESSEERQDSIYLRFDTESGYYVANFTSDTSFYDFCYFTYSVTDNVLYVGGNTLSIMAGDWFLEKIVGDTYMFIKDRYTSVEKCLTIERD